MQQTPGLGLHLVQSHRFDKRVALFNVADPQILLLDAEQLAGNLGIAAKAQGIGPRLLGFCFGKFLRCGAVCRHACQLLADQAKGFCGLLVAR